jgi:hypothetical protein
MSRPKRPIFALIIGDKPNFAFEAETLVDAETLLQQSWFYQALDEYAAKACTAWNEERAIRVRVATFAEAALYHDYRAEFSEHMSQFLVARLDERLSQPG